MPLNKPKTALEPIGGAPAGRDPASGLPLRRLGERRHVHYDAVSTAKVQLNVLPGDVLEVSDDVARQLFAASRQFVEVDAADASAIVDSHLTREDEDIVAAQEAAAPAKPEKRAAKKAPVKKRAPQKKPAKVDEPKADADPELEALLAEEAEIDRRARETSTSDAQTLPAPRSTP